MGNAAQTAYQQADGEAGRIRELVLGHLPLVNHIADRLAAGLDASISEDDLIGAGALGLVEAAHRFDESKGVKFITFAYRRVKGAMVDFLRQNDWLGKSARGQLQRLREEVRRFRQEHGRKPTIEQLAKAVAMSELDVLKYLAYEKWDCVASLDQPAGQDEGHEMALGELLPADGETPLDKLQWQERVERLTAAIDALPERQKEVVVMYYYEDLYMAEMAEIFKVTESRVSQLHTEALYNLTRMLEEQQ